MNLISKFAEHRVGGGIGAALTVFAGLLFLMSPWLGQRFTDLSYDLPFRFRSNINVDEVVIVYMDEESHKELGRADAPWNGPWNRALHAQLVRQLTAFGAKAIVFDILFDTTNSNDLLFIQAVKAHGKVVLGAKIDAQLLDGQFTGSWNVTAPIDGLRKPVAVYGLVEVGTGDNIIRQHFPGHPEFPDIPPMAWKVAELTMPEPPEVPAAPRWVNYYGPPFAIPYFSYVDVLSNRVSAAAFTNKAVFVGARSTIGFTGGKGTDDWRTPYTRWTGTRSPGVEINATTYLNLFHRDWLARLSPVSEFVLFILLGILFGYGLAVSRPMVAAGLGLSGFVIITVAAILLVWRTHVWFSWVTLAGVQIPCALSWSVLWNTRKLYREKESLEKSLALAGAATPPRTPASAAEQATRKTADEAKTLFVPQPALSPGASPLAVMTPAEGTVPPIPDHDMLRCIGKGAYGEVWLARDVIGTYHAVKIVFRVSFTQPEPYEREFKGIQKFTPISRSHPGFVHVLHVGKNDHAGYFYYIMETGDDETAGQNIDPKTYSPKNLAKELARRRKFPLDECLNLGLALTAALDYLHQQQLIHRDIKPSNIIFVKGIPKLADIGLVTDLGKRGGDVSYLGTEGYIAPEGPGTAAADVYSLGKVLYEASMGRDRLEFPEMSSTLIERPDKEPFLRLNEIIVKACETNVRKRYQSAADMHADLQRLSTSVQARLKA